MPDCYNRVLVAGRQLKNKINYKLNKMKLEDNVTIVFKNTEGDKAQITITVKDLLENTIDDFCEWLDDSEPCTSSGCNNESQNFCDCGSSFEDYEIYELLLS